MTEEQKQEMLRHPVRTIVLMVGAGAVGLAIAYAIQTYGFPLVGGIEW